MNSKPHKSRVLNKYPELIVLLFSNNSKGSLQGPAHFPLFPERPPNILENRHCPEYEIQSAPWIKVSISIFVFLQI